MAKIRGLGSVERQLKAIRKKAEVARQKGVLKTAKLIEADAKANVPVKSGILLGSIGIEQKPEVTYIFASAKYAAYQEFGTGPFTKAPKGYEAYASEFKITGNGHTPPKPFLFPAFFKHQASLTVNVEEELRKMADEFNAS